MKTSAVLFSGAALLTFVTQAQDSTNSAAPAQVAVTNAVTIAPPIPEEARKHFVMGTTLFKDAKTPDDYSQIVSEFKQATDLAPQWPEALYNLALAKEAAGNYSGAMDDLKLYQKFKLSDGEARTVQDKIYALEAKSKAAAKHAADEKAKAQQEAAAAQEKMRHILAGRWTRMDSYSQKTTLAISGSDGNYRAKYEYDRGSSGNEARVTFDSFQASGRSVSFIVHSSSGWLRFDSSYDLRLSDDGTKLVGTSRTTSNTRDVPASTSDVDFVHE